MKPEIVQGGCWPTPQQELLLRAALLHGDNAFDAWKEWQAGANMDDLDLGSFRLLPLLYHSLSQCRTPDASLGRLRGVYRQTWYKNQLFFREIAEVLNAFQLAGIETCVLKGAALTVLYYKDMGLRPMQDLDVLVRLKDKDRALQLAQTLQWKLLVKAPHGWSFRNGAGREIDLHWHALAPCCREHDDDDFWTGSVALQVAGVSTRVLNPADQLLTVCVHGLAWNQVPPVRWIADAAMILNAEPIDWNRLVAQTREHELALILQEALTYLHKLVDALIPAPVMEELKELPVSHAQRWDYAAKICRPEEWTLFYAFWSYYREYLRSVEGANVLSRLFGFPGFLRYLWNLDHIRQVPVFALLGAVRRVRHQVRTDKYFDPRIP